ncbi:MAG: efflux transporter outer membrane subunit [Acetobacter indonesiensis]|jgi:NodT family efflux transporter outer membrane factor (OMF) lipoprotein|uniref:efflux transporter outer membrane subunit n=1 Tax=Acetobacter indonesiensis TaxID=104101 RepID=UPI000A3A4B97|nr:efflux transporter outer membrane subunit [Acetobacter indonesiensis]MCI1438040.1 efflux transporter outer membrane subunit [Acetobacter indonesiensis]MCI1546765.1 efflux transporter outer membrane subunit [Acetobacter indonesiensis]MCI1766117.1 efflux transporter outer membrane subunit [Acetobacter indonesiensis]MCP1231378.1 efflux transporter outer membrane subunit [Acetobacter indonesiensis]OUI94966.1 secretion protein [Acetobacter indonesiensis]
MKVCRRLGLFMASSMLLTACTVGPNYQPDRMKVPAQFKEAAEEHPATPAEIERTNKEMTEWWSSFNDPMLTSLVQQAIEGNFDLQIAGQRILAERAIRDRSASQWYPQMDANMGGGDVRYSINIDNWPIRPGNPQNRPQASMLTYGAMATWEMDVFGRIRRDVEAHERAVEASIEGRRALLMTLLSELASDYMLLRVTQLQIHIATDNIRVAKDAVDLTNKLYLEGVGNTLQIAQAQAELDTQIAAREPLKTRVSQITHAISVLLGKMPGELEDQLKVVRPLPTVPAFPATMPSIVMANRPDIRMAERKYALATAQIGVAVANLYPHFVIPLTFNPNASAMYQLFQVNAMSWQFLMMASLPLMHGGKMTAEVRAAQAAAEASRLEYRQAVLTGFKEVEDAMAAWHDDIEYAEQLHKAAEDSATASERARKLYGAGLVGFLEVLTTERTTLNAQNQEALAKLERLRDAVNLYTALGAGWRGVPLTNSTLPVSLETQNVLARAFKQ